MKIAMVAMHDHSIYPAFYYLAVGLSRIGVDVIYVSQYNEFSDMESDDNIKSKKISLPKGILRRLPLVRGGAR